MSEQIRILCVDDEPNVLKSLERLFLDMDYEILTALSAADGLSLLEATPGIQIVMSDYRMPGMNGVAFLREACRRWPDTVRIVLSGYADTSSVVAAINEGEIYKFIPKPWNDEDLKVTVANAVERYELYRKMQELMNELHETNGELQRMNQELEHKVLERTATLTIQNRVLSLSQTILDVLPVGVIGIDPSGMIVQCNMSAAELLGAPSWELIGAEHAVSLPPPVTALVSETIDAPVATAEVDIGGTLVTVRAVVMNTEGQRCTVLEFYRSDRGLR